MSAAMPARRWPRAGYRPVVYDNLSRGHREAVRWGPARRRRSADRARLAAAMRAHRVDAVMHFAAFAYVGESVSDPEIYYPQQRRRTPWRCSRRCARPGCERSSSPRPAPSMAFPRRCRSARRRRRRRSTPTARPSWRSSGRCTGIGAGLRHALHGAALFQRRRGRSRRRDRRGPRAGNPSDPAGAARRARPGRRRSRSTAPIIRPRTAPRSATTSMSATWPTRMSARSAIWRGRRQRRAQPRHRPRLFGARGDRRGRADRRPRGAAARGGAAAGRPAGTRRRPGRAARGRSAGSRATPISTRSSPPRCAWDDAGAGRGTDYRCVRPRACLRSAGNDIISPRAQHGHADREPTIGSCRDEPIERDGVARSARRTTLDADAPVRVHGKFFFAGEAKHFVKGVTYGPFAVGSHGAQFPERAVVERDFALMARGRASTRVRVFTVPPVWLLDRGRRGRA